MKYLSAYMLAVMGGNASPSADDVKGILGAVGAEVDDTILDKLMSELSGKDINEVIAEGMTKFSSVPSGGGAAAAGGGGGGGGDAAPAEEEKKEEEEEEEEDDDMGFGLFD
ncbi:hypothetical protein I4F81_007920 [Pyropia yezoensis]|uniref:Uncharacterized protein n=1 Tax=Pyropia yezoensis TaxID=2788 RepID=A0ACC3C5N4_PYRYE|nr:hypothetical protein I4F81_007920 [Neopyropia yezoensis]